MKKIIPFGIRQQDSFTFETDARGVFTSLSPAVFYALGYTPDELLGKSFASIVPPDSGGQSSAMMRAIARGHPLKGMEVELARKDGRAVDAQVSGIPIVERGKFCGYQGVVLAFTNHRPGPDASRSSAADTEFLLDMVCHDINNMNQVVAGYLELAQHSISPDSDARRYIDICISTIASSSRIVHNVQKLQRNGPGPRTLEKVNIGRIVSEAVDHYTAQFGREVKISYRQAGGCFVMANELLKDAFMNIIGNAIKHSKGSPVIEVTVDEITDGGRRLCRVTVDDNGPGMPDSVKSTLFRRREPGHSTAGGKGLVLYIVGKLIEGFGGNVRAEDRVPGDYRKGSRLVVILPLAGT